MRKTHKCHPFLKNHLRSALSRKNMSLKALSALLRGKLAESFLGCLLRVYQTTQWPPLHLPRSCYPPRKLGTALIHAPTDSAGLRTDITEPFVLGLQAMARLLPASVRGEAVLQRCLTSAGARAMRTLSLVNLQCRRHTRLLRISISRNVC